MRRLPPLLTRTFTPRVIEWKDGFAGLFRLDANIGLLSAHLSRPGARRLDRRRRHQAQARLRDRPARDGRHRPRGDVGQRLPLRRRRAAPVPRLRRDVPRRPRADGRDRQGDQRRLRRGRCACSAARRRSCPSSTSRANTTSPASASASSSASTSLDGKDIRAGDKVVGLACSGLHSNGYSLARKIAFEHAGLKPDSLVEELGRTVADEFLGPRGSMSEH